MLVFLLFFFFFKQKTAYEMRISDWSSDVCSSDLEEIAKLKAGPAPRKLPPNPRSSGGYSGGNKTGSGGRAYSKSKGKSSSYSSGNGNSQGKVARGSGTRSSR